MLIPCCCAIPWANWYSGQIMNLVYLLNSLFTRPYWSISLYCSLAIDVQISFSVTSPSADDRHIGQGFLELLCMESLLHGDSVVERKGKIVFCFSLWLSKGFMSIRHISRLSKSLKKTPIYKDHSLHTHLGKSAEQHFLNI